MEQEHVSLQVRIPAKLRDGLRVAAAMKRTTMAALVERSLIDAGYEDWILPHEQNAVVRSATIEGATAWGEAFESAGKTDDSRA